MGQGRAHGEFVGPTDAVSSPERGGGQSIGESMSRIQSEQCPCRLLQCRTSTLSTPSHCSLLPRCSKLRTFSRASSPMLTLSRVASAARRLAVLTAVSVREPPTGSLSTTAIAPLRHMDLQTALFGESTSFMSGIARRSSPGRGFRGGCPQLDGFIQAVLTTEV